MPERLGEIQGMPDEKPDEGISRPLDRIGPADPPPRKPSSGIGLVITVPEIGGPAVVPLSEWPEEGEEDG